MPVSFRTHPFIPILSLLYGLDIFPSTASVKIVCKKRQIDAKVPPKFSEKISTENPLSVEADSGFHFLRGRSGRSSSVNYLETFLNAIALAAARETTAATTATFTMSLEPVFGISLPELEEEVDSSSSTTSVSSSVSEIT